MSESTVKQILAVASGVLSLEQRLPLLLPLRNVQPAEADWAEGITVLAWTYRALNEQREASACARLVMASEPLDSLWRHKCVIIWSSLEAGNNRPIDVAALRAAEVAMQRNKEFEAAHEAAGLLASEFCATGQFDDATSYAFAAISYVQSMRTDYKFEGHSFPPLVRGYQSLAWIQAAAGQPDAARATLQLALDELAQPAKLGSGGTIELLRRRVQERLDALPLRAQ